MKRNLLLLSSLLSFFVLFAEIPNGYYDAAIGKNKAGLKTALSSIISSGYKDNGYNGLFRIYKESDVKPNGKVWDMYSTCDFDFSNTCGSYSNIGDCYNREHSVPQSWFNRADPMRSDAFHVYPTDGKVNGKRSNHPFGETKNGTPVGGKGLGKTGTCSFPGYTGTVFEPVDEYKGDFARTYFYFVTRYENRMGSIDRKSSFNGTKYPSFSGWAMKMFLKWHREDPVSPKEIKRNDAVYKYQHNRNPFIDHPELAEFIWGDKMGLSWNDNLKTPTVTTPTNGTVVELGKTAIDVQLQKEIEVKAFNLKGDITLSIDGDDSSLFSLSAYHIAKSEVEKGYKLLVTFKSASYGEKKSNLIINGGGITNHTVKLTANVTDNFMATNATAVNANGFTANWTTSANATDYSLNVYTKTVGNEAYSVIIDENFSKGLPSGWNSKGYVNFEKNVGAIRLGSGKINGTIISPTLNLSKKSKLTIKAQYYNKDKGTKLKVIVDEKEIKELDLDNSSKIYEIELDPYTAQSTITLSTDIPKKRAYIYLVKVETGNEAEIITPVDGFPKKVGNVTSYVVENLDMKIEHFYTVTPIGNGEVKSNEVTVGLFTSVPFIKTEKNIIDPKIAISRGNISIDNIPKNATLTILDILGKTVFTSCNKTNISTKLNSRGIYIVSIYTENDLYSVKVKN